MNDPLSIIGRIYSIPMNDPFSRQHVLMLLFHVVFKLVENDVLVAIEDDTLDAVVRRVSLDRCIVYIKVACKWVNFFY